MPLPPSTVPLFPDLRGKIAIVTGGSRGIGLMIAEGLVSSGAKVYISSRKADACNAAKKRIEDITADVEVGRVYDGTVLKLLDFGAIVQLLPGKDGLLHISQIANERVNAVSDYLKEGQHVKVKVLEADEKGRVRLSMKAVKEAAAATQS